MKKEETLARDSCGNIGPPYSSPQYGHCWDIRNLKPIRALRLVSEHRHNLGNIAGRVLAGKTTYQSFRSEGMWSSDPGVFTSAHLFVALGLCLLFQAKLCQFALLVIPMTPQIARDPLPRRPSFRFIHIQSIFTEGSWRKLWTFICMRAEYRRDNPNTTSHHLAGLRRRVHEKICAVMRPGSGNDYLLLSLQHI